MSGSQRYVAGQHRAVWMDQDSHPFQRTAKVNGRTEYLGYFVDDIKTVEMKGRLYFDTVEEAKAAVRWGSAAFSIEPDGSLECVRSNYDSSG